MQLRMLDNMHKFRLLKKGYAYYNVHNRDDPDGF